MKTIYDKITRDELIARINALQENGTAQWGKMNVYQMLKHCIVYEEMMLGKQKYKRSFLSILFGKMALKDFLTDDSPLKRNMPTLTELKITENGNEAAIASGKKQWIALLEEYAHNADPGLIHSFFGKLTKEQVGHLVYKHTDHHLRQFNG